MKKNKYFLMLKKFIYNNIEYSIINLILILISPIILFIDIKIGIVYLIIDILLNLIFIECGGIEFMKNLKKKNLNNEDIKKKKGNKNKKRKNKIKKGLVNGILFFLLIFLILAVLFAIYVVIKAPDFNPDNLYRAESSIVYDKGGRQIAKLGVEKRKKVSYDDLPQVLVDAIIATEDSRYMQHSGFDAPRFIKASIGQIVNKITKHGNAGGGSTLTMQVSKNNYTSVESSGFEGITRKFTDIYISVFRLEKNYSKEQIMEFYVNTPYLGNSSYGVEQACQSYFGKSVADINLSEASLIAGLFQAPSSYDPYRFPDLAEKRRSTVLYLMKKHGYITEEEEKIANSKSVKSLLKSANTENGKNEYQSYLDVVIDEVEEKTGNNPYTSGMKIYTNLDIDKQNVLNKIMSGETWDWKDEKVNAGIAIVDVNNGALVAVGGGRNQEGERSFNNATMMKRQIGSCAKPLFDYGPAFEYNGASEATQVLDAEYTYSNGARVKNANGGYMGLMTYKTALANSRNIPALKVFQSVENSKIVEFVTRLGITPEIDSTGYIHEAHALGAFNGSNPKELAGAYAAFANGGYYTSPYTVAKVEYIDSNKTVSLKPKKVKAMSDSTAYMITDALMYAVNTVNNIYGTVPGVQLAAKTGTSNFDEETRRKYGFPSSANNDMWVTGFTPEYSVSLWYGYSKIEKGYYNGNDGYSARGKLFRQVISDISTKGKSFTVPSSVVKGTIEKETFPGLLPSANTPDDMKVTDYFKKGTIPTEVSGRYATLADPSNLSANTSGNNVNLSWGASSPSAYFNQDKLAESLKGLYHKQAGQYAAGIISSNGEFGYEILAQSATSTTSLGFTTDTKFTTKRQSKDVTYIVKTCYSVNKVTQSPGVSVKVKGTGIDETPETTSDLFNVEIIEDPNMPLTYEGSDIYWYDPGVKVISDGVDITNKATITSSVSNGASKSGNTITFSDSGEYVVTYTIKYNNSSTTVKRTITIRSS